MYGNRNIEKKLYNQFIKPTKEHNRNYIGIEIELPILNLNKDAVNFDVVYKITHEFLDEFTSFQILEKDYNGNIQSLKNIKNGDVISYDCSYNNIEFALGREKNLFTINNRFLNYYKFFKITLKNIIIH